MGEMVVGGPAPQWCTRPVRSLCPHDGRSARGCRQRSAVVITAATIAEYYTRSDISFVRISDIEQCSIDLCTREGDSSPAVIELRKAVSALGTDR